jgi:hypothetical protein
MTRYRSIPIEIEAIQATNDNIAEVKAFAGDAFVEDGGYGYPHLKVQDGYHQCIYWGDWIAKDENGFRLMLTRDIQNFFEEVEEPPKLATGGLVKNPGGVVGSDSGCVIYFDPRVERVITAEEARNSPSFKAALEKFRQSVAEVQDRESQDGDSPNS